MESIPLDLQKQLIAEQRGGLSYGNELTLDDGTTVLESRCTLSLADYRSVLMSVCVENHKSNCEKCLMLMTVCNEIKANRVVVQGSLWRQVSTLQYKSDKARRLFLQAPLTLITVCDIYGESQVFVCERKDKDLYNAVYSTIKKFQSSDGKISLKGWLSDVLTLSNNEAESERLKYVASAVCNTSRRETKNLLGISMGRNNCRGANVAESVQHVKAITGMNNELMKAEIRDKLGNCSLDGIQLSADDVSDEEASEVFEDEASGVFEDEASGVSEDEASGVSEDEASGVSEDEASGGEASGDETGLGVYEAVGESERERVKKRIVGKWKLRTKVSVAKLRLMRRKVSKQSREISQRHPDIGQVMEQFAKNCDIGADKWRRTGMLTFGGEKKKEKRLTYKKLQEHLVQHYGEEISIGTVVELCAKRHKRRRTSNRYKGVANLRFRKAWKGYTLKYNPDAHWSRAMYKQMDVLQEKTEKSSILGRDDQAGFRLDTTYTHKQYSALGSEKTVTTRTDFVNKNATVLQVSSYNFPETSTTPETCIGVVKGSLVHSKSPSQHMADLIMLEGKNELSNIFKNRDVEYVRVDGANDEGPSHLEVQFLWTERHLSKARKVTMVTTRCSGDSYLNRVELQNGHLSKGHSNLFIPSTLNGSPYNNGEFDVDLFKRNIKSAIEQYIARVEDTAAMGTSIMLYPGEENSSLLRRRPYLLTFLKGTKVDKEELKSNQPVLFAYFESIWKLRLAHMVECSLPIKYAFILKCCFAQTCIHPVCQKGEVAPLAWYPGGPTIEDTLPVPIVMSDVCECKKNCNGHYERRFTRLADDIPAVVPSLFIESRFQEDPVLNDARLCRIARKCLLDPDSVGIYWNHLADVKRNRQKGVEKAKVTRARKAAGLV